MEIWQTIIMAIGGNVVLLAVLGWLSKSLISQMLSKDIAGFKSSLKSESDAISQKLKHDFQITALEHQVKFSKLHEKRADVIAELYSLLVQSYWDASSFASPMEWNGEVNKQEKYSMAMNSVADFYRYFDKHRIYIPENLCIKIDNFVQEMRKKVIGFGVYVKYDDSQLPTNQLESKHKAWMDAWDYIERKVPETKSELENHLRILLGEA